MALPGPAGLWWQRVRSATLQECWVRRSRPCTSRTAASRRKWARRPTASLPTCLLPLPVPFDSPFPFAHALALRLSLCPCTLHCPCPLLLCFFSSCYFPLQVIHACLAMPSAIIPTLLTSHCIHSCVNAGPFVSLTKLVTDVVLLATHTFGLYY